MSLVSIVIPVYNAEKYLARCLDSIVNQTHKNIEILLINDGSVDNTFNICEEYARNDRRIKLFHEDNQGVSVARNCGIDNATGEYLVFIDADDYIEHNYVETLVNTIEKEKVDMVICGIKEIISDSTINRKARGEITGVLGDDYFNIIDFLCVPFSKIYRNQIIKEQKLKFLKELNYAEDELFNLNYYKNVKSYVFIDSPLYIYDHHLNSLSDKKNLRSSKHLTDYVSKLYLERKILDEVKFDRKEQVIGEQGMRAILYMASLDTYLAFKKDAALVKNQLYRNLKYNKLSKMIFACLLNFEMYLPLYLGCKLRNYLRNF